MNDRWQALDVGGSGGQEAGSAGVVPLGDGDLSLDCAYLGSARFRLTPGRPLRRSWIARKRTSSPTCLRGSSATTLWYVASLEQRGLLTSEAE
jgi:hypothetical protein